MISKKAIAQLAQHHGEPVILTAGGKGDKAAVMQACEAMLNRQDLLCLAGPGEFDLTVFDLTVDLTKTGDQQPATPGMNNPATAPAAA
jgi:hypothetical protein